MRKRREMELPTLEELQEELERVRYRKSFRGALWGTVSSILTAAAVAVLLAQLVFPVLKVQGGSMSPTLMDGQVVAAVAQKKCRRGDLVAFYYNNKIMIKRVIAVPGEWVNIDESGNVYINDELLEEPYLGEGGKALGECDVELPLQVPEERLFVLGDNREATADSRSSEIGCVEEDAVLGKLAARIWPLESAGLLI